MEFFFYYTWGIGSVDFRGSLKVGGDEVCSIDYRCDCDDVEFDCTGGHYLYVNTAGTGNQYLKVTYHAPGQADRQFEIDDKSDPWADWQCGKS